MARRGRSATPAIRRFSCPTRAGRNVVPESERGASLVELVVAVGITVLVLGFLATAVVQFFDVTRWGNDRLVIDSDFQTAALWLGRDAGEANAFNPGSGTTYGILRWPDGSNQYRYSYSAADTALVREHILGGSVLSNLQVAKHIAAQGDVTFTSSAGLLTVTLTATSGAVSQTVEFKFDMRAQ